MWTKLPLKAYILLILGGSSLLNSNISLCQSLSEPHPFGNSPKSTCFLRIDWRQGMDVTSSRTTWVEDLHRKTTFSGFDIRAGIWTGRGEQWSRLCNYPAVGIGYTRYQLHNAQLKRMVGNPNAVYLFGSFPITFKSDFRFGFDLGAGIAFNLNQYDPYTNPYNDAIGSSIQAYFDIGAFAEWSVTPKLGIVGGLNISHTSNGGLRTPNFGLDLLGYKLGLTYHFLPNDIPTSYTSEEIQSMISREKPGLLPMKNQIFNISFSIGGNSTINQPIGSVVLDSIDIRGPKYFASTFVFEWEKKYGGIAAFSLGLNFMYNGSYVEYVPEDRNTFLDKSVLALTFGHELFIQRVGILTQLGVNILQSKEIDEHRGYIFFRVGFRYRFTQNIWLQLGLKTRNGAIADYPELGVGYSFIQN